MNEFVEITLSVFMGLVILGFVLGSCCFAPGEILTAFGCSTLSLSLYLIKLRMAEHQQAIVDDATSIPTTTTISSLFQEDPMPFLVGFTSLIWIVIGMRRLHRNEQSAKLLILPLGPVGSTSKERKACGRNEILSNKNGHSLFELVTLPNLARSSNSSNKKESGTDDSDFDQENLATKDILIV